MGRIRKTARWVFSVGCDGPSPIRRLSSAEQMGEEQNALLREQNAILAGRPRTVGGPLRGGPADEFVVELAEEPGVDITQVFGSGRDGKIKTSDVRRHAEAPNQPGPGSWMNYLLPDWRTEFGRPVLTSRAGGYVPGRGASIELLSEAERQRLEDYWAQLRD